MAKFILSTNAQESLYDIKSYSKEHFGEQQTKIYIENIYKRMRKVAKNPKIGKKRDDILDGYYSIIAGSHIIYYTIKDTHIDIVDVLHQRMEPLRYPYEESNDSTD